MRVARRAPRVVSAVAIVAAAAAVAPVACSGFPFPPGYVAGPVYGVPPTCEGDAYLAVPSSDCPSSTCPSAVAFAVCDGTSFSGCTCSQPPGVLIPSLDVGAGGDEAGFECGSPFGTEGCSGLDGGFFEGGDGEAEGGAFFDVGDKSACAGHVAKKIPGVECAPCRSATAYLLCDGVFYSECSCELPPGYELVDGGAPRKDAGGKDAPDEGNATAD